MNRHLHRITLVSLAIFTPLLYAQSSSPTLFGIDSSRSKIGFVARHLEFLNVEGSFTDFDGTLSLSDQDLTTLELTVTIQASSLYTGRGIVDDNLRSDYYFEVETFPEITFVSSGVTQNDSEYKLSGMMTMKGVTQEISLPITLSEYESDRSGNPRVRIKLGGEINRRDFDVGYDGMPDRLINDIVRLNLQLEGIQQ